MHAEPLTLARIYAEPALAGQPPIQLKLAPDSSRVTFLRGRPEDSFALDLWAYDIKTKRTARLVDAQTLVSGAETLSDEEKSRRERQRIASLSGIVEYYFSADGKTLLFPLGGALFLVDIASAKVRKLTEATDGAVSDPKFSPKGRYVSFVRAQNLFAIELKTGRVLTLSTDGGGTISNGVAEFVAQEEMARFTGYWWAPDESHIAMQRVDESPVPIAKRFEIYPDRTEVIEQRYPAAGQANAKVALFVVPLNAPEKAVAVDLGADSDIYLARVDWLPIPSDAKTSARIAVQRQSRDQSTLELLFADAKTGATTVILREHSKSFVNLHNGLRFLKSTPEFLWMSERSGFNHLYRYDLTGKLLAAITTSDAGSSSGAWQLDALLGVDESAGRVYVSANLGDAIQQHTYSVALDGKSAPVALTHTPGSHVSTFDTEAKLFLDTYSDTLVPPQVRLHRADGTELAVLDANVVKGSHPLAPYEKDLITPLYGSVPPEASEPGAPSLQYRMYQPRNFDAAKRYPALIYTYGGPHVQVLKRAFGDLLAQVLAQQGFVVFSVDNRGSARRGAAFESAIYRGMGTLDVADQLRGARWLGAQSFIDKSRIGVYGWSYGGYMTLHMLAQGGALFKAGAAGAPVTDWALYDTHYTERYMATPANNAAGYKFATVASHLDGLKARLLLIHGMADDNVLFSNSTGLMSELQSRGVAFDLMTYPGMKHGPANPKTKFHIYQGIEAFFRRELGLVF
jgi:dipeptidyl-peptidase 4